MNKLAVRLKELREEKKLSQRELALRTSLSKSAICSWERGLRSPSVDVIIALCKFFQVSSDYLIGLKDD